ncbi:MAG: response regulator, partial [Gallionella sp.]|nr:response regulator [Gallionella sp.]
GYRTDEVKGKSPSILSSGMHGANFYVAMWDSINSTGTWDGEIWNRRKNGEIYPEHLTITAVKDAQGNVTHYVGALTDSTQRQKTLDELRSTAKQLEQANAQIEEERAMLAQRVEERTAQLQYANHAKDSFLATMSHEIRTPLAGLLGMMELLSLSKLEHEQTELLGAAQRSGNSLLRIVNDILDWSKIEAGKLELSPQTASIKDMLQSVVQTYTQLANDKGVPLKLEIDSRLAAAHLFDPLRVSQILNNFTSNAIKFTPRGNVHIRAEWLGNLNGRDTVRFSVKDSGIGISKEQQSRLFEQYEQAGADTARMYGGTGLGLAICRKLAELMGGTLAVNSMPGKGSTFSITVDLPVAEQPASTGDQASGVGHDTQDGTDDVSPLVAPGKTIPVLVVDDHPINRMLLKQQLGLLGLHPDAAADGVEALALWQSKHYDLVITDCHMPQMDGYELTRTIRDIEKKSGARPIPIIAWTANVLAEEEQHCRAAGMDDILTKPTELADLRAKLLNWLDRAGVLERPSHNG